MCVNLIRYLTQDHTCVKLCICTNIASLGHDYCMLLHSCNGSSFIFKLFVITYNKIITWTLQQQWRILQSSQQCAAGSLKLEKFKKKVFLQAVKSLIICFESAVCMCSLYITTFLIFVCANPQDQLELLLDIGSKTGFYASTTFERKGKYGYVSIASCVVVFPCVLTSRPGSATVQQQKAIMMSEWPILLYPYDIVCIFYMLKSLSLSSMQIQQNSISGCCISFKYIQNHWN